MQKLRIGVLMGGRSQECEVSFNSGRTICDHLDTSTYDVIPLFQTQNGVLYQLPWSFLYRGKIADFEHRLPTEAQKIQWDNLKSLVDIIYIAMHGRYAEDGIMQGVLELLSIPYVGSKVLASALGMDKIVQKKILKAHGIAVAAGFSIMPPERHDKQKLMQKMHEENITFPCVVKPQKEGSSLGVRVVDNESALFDAIEYAVTINIKEQGVLVEEKLIGMEFSCIVIARENGMHALMPTEIVIDSQKQFFDYEQKYMPGRSLQFTPARCSDALLEKIKKTALRVTEILEFSTIARIDGFLVQDVVVITDPNSFSGAAPSSFMFKQAAYAGLNPAQFINHLITMELKNYENKTT